MRNFLRFKSHDELVNEAFNSDLDGLDITDADMGWRDDEGDVTQISDEGWPTLEGIVVDWHEDGSIEEVIL